MQAAEAAAAQVEMCFLVSVRKAMSSSMHFMAVFFEAAAFKAAFKLPWVSPEDSTGLFAEANGDENQPGSSCGSNN